MFFLIIQKYGKYSLFFIDEHLKNLFGALVFEITVDIEPLLY